MYSESMSEAVSHFVSWQRRDVRMGRAVRPSGKVLVQREVANALVF